MFLQIIFILSELSKSITGIYPFTFQSCPPPIITAGRLTEILIILSNTIDNWPVLCEFQIKLNSETIFIYKPFGNQIITNNNRFKVKQLFERNRDFKIISRFFNDDTGLEVEYGYVTDKYNKLNVFCITFVSPDLTPFAVLQRLASPFEGIREKPHFTEGEFVRIVCKVYHLPKNGTFKIVFPYRAKITRMIDDNYYTQTYMMQLKNNIKGRNISCIVPKGYSTWSNELTDFLKLPIYAKKEETINFAISISIGFGLALLFSVIIGIYLLIFKVRSEITKDQVRYHFSIQTDQESKKYLYDIHKHSTLNPFSVSVSYSQQSQ